MGRRQLEIKLIKDARKRKSTFSKRKDGIFKKVLELGILCNSRIHLMIFDSDYRQLHEVVCESDPQFRNDPCQGSRTLSDYERKCSKKHERVLGLCRYGKYFQHKKVSGQYPKLPKRKTDLRKRNPQPVEFRFATPMRQSIVQCPSCEPTELESLEYNIPEFDSYKYQVEEEEFIPPRIPGNRKSLVFIKTHDMEKDIEEVENVGHLGGLRLLTDYKVIDGDLYVTPAKHYPIE